MLVFVPVVREVQDLMDGEERFFWCWHFGFVCHEGGKCCGMMLGGCRCKMEDE